MFVMFSMFCPEDENSRFLQNVHNNVQDYVAHIPKDSNLPYLMAKQLSY
jgi:hypothetical protein